ncbi:hypothetical protein AcidC75_13910 [Acidisoma sp. C75]
MPARAPLTPIMRQRETRQKTAACAEKQVAEARRGPAPALMNVDRQGAKKDTFRRPIW